MVHVNPKMFQVENWQNARLQKLIVNTTARFLAQKHYGDEESLSEPESETLETTESSLETESDTDETEASISTEEDVLQN